MDNFSVGALKFLQEHVCYVHFAEGNYAFKNVVILVTEVRDMWGVQLYISVIKNKF